MNIDKDLRVDKNFRTVTYENKVTGKKEIMSALRFRFSKIKTLSDKDYIEKHNLEKTTFSKIMKRNARVNGTKIRDLEGNTAKIFKQLQKDGIWIGALPWEVKNDEQRVS